MTAVTINGNAYSDDGSQTRDMRFGGHQTWLLPMLADTMAEVEAATDAAVSADSSAAAALQSETDAANYAAALKGTSTTSLPITVASKSLTTQAGKQFAAGQYVILVDHATPSQWMLGQVTSYNSGTGALVVNVEDVAGSGTIALWDIFVSGKRGEQGPAGVPAGLASIDRSSNVQLVQADSGKLINITSGSFTQTFDTSANLGNGWWCYINNTGSGVITLDPSGSETIDGLSTQAIRAGESRIIQCSGTTLISVQITQSLASVPMDAFVLLPPPTWDGASSPNTVSFAGATYLKSGVLDDRVSYPNAQITSYSVDSTQTTAPEAAGYLTTDGAGRVFGIGNSTSKLVYFDGTSWYLSATAPTFYQVQSGYVNNKWIGVDGNAAGSRKAFYSSDGTTFTENATAMPSSKFWVSVAFSATRAVAISQAAGGGASTSGAYTDDGITWNSCTLPSAIWQKVFYACSKFIAINNSTTVNNYAYSSDGISWTLGTFPVADSVHATFGGKVFGNPTIFYLQRTTGYVGYTTTDAINWSLMSYTLAAQRIFSKVGDRHFFTGNAANTHILTTTDFSTFVPCFKSVNGSGVDAILPGPGCFYKMSGTTLIKYLTSDVGFVGAKIAVSVATGNADHGGGVINSHYYKRVA